MIQRTARPVPAHLRDILSAAPDMDDQEPYKAIGACMGGWCSKDRELCQHYRSTGEPDSEPHERLCEPGKADAWKPIQVLERKQ